MPMEFAVLLKPGTTDGEAKSGPEEFISSVPYWEKEVLMQAVKRIVSRGEKPMIQIKLRYGYGGLTVVESQMAPVLFTEAPGVYPLRAVMA